MTIKKTIMNHLRTSLILAALLSITIAVAQSQTTAFEFLKLPESAHASALAGAAVALPEDNPTLTSVNPALLGNIHGRSASLAYMNYLSDTQVGHARFSDIAGSRASYSFSADFVGYGEADMTAPDASVQGRFSCKDMAFAGSFSYLLSDNWNGGLTGRIVYSHYGTYTSVALDADLGLAWFNDDGSFSAGAAVLNLGGQVKPFENEHEKLPADIVAGISYTLQHAPIRLNLGMHDLNHWNSDYYYSPDKELTFAQILGRHFMVGADFNFSEQFYVSAGCHLQRRAELAQNGGRGLEGFSIGTGLNINKLSLGLSFGRYQVSTSSLLLNFALSL